ncbi:MAG: lysylphosphatidylglycerol synthase transmembrane domain-containing protein [Clostridia bacterium]
MEKTEKAKKIKKTIRNLIVFILLIGLTFYLIFKDQNVLEILNIAVSVKKRYILVAIIAMCLYLLGETINITRILKELGEKSTFLRNIRYTLIGFFFSSITPAASGGQPMEIYYMHKEKIAVANSTLALLVHLTSFQIVTITLGILSTILHFEIVKSGLIYLVVLGILLNSTALTLLAISIFSKRLSKGLINFAVKVLRFFRIPNIEKKQESLEKELEKYQESAVYIKEHKKLMIKTLVTTFIQVIIYYSIPYWVYLAFGFTGYNFFQIVTLQAMLYATVSGIPSPGAVGVSEGAFIEIFKGVFPATMMNSAILLNRGASFYLFVIISAIITTITALKTKNYEVKEELNNN